MCVCVCVLQEKLIQAIKRIKHEVDESREAERETYIESVEVEVLCLPYTQSFTFIADLLVRASFGYTQNLQLRLHTELLSFHFP